MGIRPLGEGISLQINLGFYDRHRLLTHSFELWEGLFDTHKHGIRRSNRFRSASSYVLKRTLRSRLEHDLRFTMTLRYMHSGYERGHPLQISMSPADHHYLVTDYIKPGERHIDQLYTTHSKTSCLKHQIGS